MKATPWIVLAGCLLNCSCTDSGTSTVPAFSEKAALEAAIRETTLVAQGRSTALHNGDIEAALSAYVDDAVWMPSLSEEFVGKELARAKLKVFLADSKIEEEQQAEEHSLLAPDVLLERGNFATEIAPRMGGEPASDGGTYLTIWRKASDGKWRIAYQMWTSHRSFSAGANGASK
jgi:ketosteroid isomerase-like protein